MRMSFWLGGIVGAAAALYFSRNRDMLQTFGMERMKNTFDKVTEVAGRMTARPGEKDRSADSENSGSAEAGNDSARVREWIRKDPEVRKQVEDIMRENQ